MSKLKQLLSLEYGAALPAQNRRGHDYPVFGSNGEVGRHQISLVDGPGIVVGRKGSVGKVCWSDGPFWPIDTTYWVKCVPSDRRWMYWLLCHLPLSGLDSSTGVPGLNRNDVYDLDAFEPLGYEKASIARVLDTLDTTIRKTEAIIAKLKQVKQGLLHDLLTRGIDANGELRPPQSQAPHLYKQSPLGWIPNDWSASSIGDTCTNVVDCPHSTPVFRENGVLVARTMHIKGGVFLEHIASYVSEAAYQERITRLCPEPGDVVFTREAPVGEAFVIPVGMRICLGQRVMLLRPRPDKLRGEFLVAQVYSGAVADRIAALTAGTTNPHLNVAEVRGFLVPLPSMEEQSAIGQHLSRLEDDIHAESVKGGKLSAMKSGLMDDLLSGRVRVTSLLEAAPKP